MFELRLLLTLNVSISLNATGVSFADTWEGSLQLLHYLHVYPHFNLVTLAKKNPNLKWLFKLTFAHFLLQFAHKHLLKHLLGDP